MTKEINCIFSRECEAPMCPMQSREENKKTVWFPEEPVCKLKDVPDWVKQQRKIAHHIKARNAETFFELVMLETPFRVKGSVKGITPVIGLCRNCLMIDWFIENRLTIPEEVEAEHLLRIGSEEEKEKGQTVH
jgi:hypothetical protein